MVSNFTSIGTFHLLTSRREGKLIELTPELEYDGGDVYLLEVEHRTFRYTRGIRN